MKKLLLLLLFIPLVSFGQTKTGLELCIQYQKSFSAFSTEKEANEALDKILNVIGASKNFTLVPCDDISNALAVTFKGERFILFDEAFMRKLTQLTNNWSSLFILAHEVGHHINGHTRDFLLATVLGDQSLEDRRKEELEADEFASFIVSKLGASYSQIEETIDLIASNESDLYSTHPNYDKRIAAVKKGFDRGYSDSDTSSSNTYNSNENSTEYINKGEIKPNYENPRGRIRASYGNWYSSKYYPLENILHNQTDPFKKKEIKDSEPIKNLVARTQGKSLSPYGSKNVEIGIKIQNYTNNYVDWNDGNGKEEYLYIPNKSFHIELIGWADYPKEIEYSQTNRTYATFEYMIDGKFSGQFVTYIGWTDMFYDFENSKELEEPIKVPIELQFNGWLYKSQQKENYEFVERLKAGKKLYLRFGKLFNWNGYKNENTGEFDTSKTSNKYQIPKYTYEFDLTGSSKALNH
jgi:hypothetical protein